MNQDFLQFLELSAGYNGRRVLHRVSGKIPPGGRVAVIGPNGCGKSTLLKALMGLIPAEVEIATLEGADFSRASTAKRNRMGLGLMRQNLNIFPSLDAKANLEMAFTGSKNAFENRLEEVLHIFPLLSEGLSKRAGLFSGGQRQSLALAMVLMNRPKLLLLDEPLAGLSPRAADDLLAALGRMQTSSNLAWIIVEHRLPLLVEAVDQVWILREGEIIHRDTDTSILKNPEALATHYNLT